MLASIEPEHEPEPQPAPLLRREPEAEGTPTGAAWNYLEVPVEAEIATPWLQHPLPPVPPVRPAPPEPAPVAIEPRPAPERSTLADIDTARIVIVTAQGSPRDVQSEVRRVLGHLDQLHKRVVLIDASSRRRGSAPGISDLSQGSARFADVVHGTGINKSALIPWGRQAQFLPDARQVHVLLEALCELYDVVVISLDSEGMAASASLVRLADMIVEPASETPRKRQRRAA